MSVRIARGSTVASNHAERRRTRVRSHASQYKLVVGIDADVELELGGRSVRAAAVLVPPHVAQSMRLRGVRRVLAQETHASIESVATRLGLSPERLRHLVKAESGLSLRCHRLWHRTLEATERVIAGSTIGRAAIDAGFADLAHCSRAFAAFFGRTPSSLTGPSYVTTPYRARQTVRSGARAGWARDEPLGHRAPG